MWVMRLYSLIHQKWNWCIQMYTLGNLYAQNFHVYSISPYYEISALCQMSIFGMICFQQGNQLYLYVIWANYAFPCFKKKKQQLCKSSEEKMKWGGSVKWKGGFAGAKDRRCHTPQNSDLFIVLNRHSLQFASPLRFSWCGHRKPLLMPTRNSVCVQYCDGFLLSCCAYLNYIYNIS